MEPLPVETIFRALADVTRRRVVERLAHEGAASVSDLAEPFDMALPSFMQHLNVLEDAGLVRSQKVGRVRTVSLQENSLQPAQDWLDTQQQLWERRLDQLDDYLQKMKDKQ